MIRAWLFPTLVAGNAVCSLACWYGKEKNTKRLYPGPYPSSETGTSWLYQEIKNFRAEVIVSVFAPLAPVDYDAPGRKIALRNIGYLHNNLTGTHPGSPGNYAGVHPGIPVTTLELPPAGIVPTGEQISRLWTDLVCRLTRKP